MAKCKECGYELQGNESTCPQCGCPTENAGAADFMDVDVLNKGRGTEAEAVISIYADTILKVGNRLALICLILSVIYGVCLGGIQLSQGGDTLGFLTMLSYIFYGVIYYILIKFAAKVTWGLITLFVNISSTLKRIEIKLEKNGFN